MKEAIAGADIDNFIFRGKTYEVRAEGIYKLETGEDCNVSE